MIIGCGTGKCGTTSLASLLNRQHNVSCTHERVWKRMQWYGDKLHRLRIVEDVMLSNRCDVNLGWLAYIDEFMQLGGESIRVVCLKRDRDAFVDSLYRQCRRRGTIKRMLCGETDVYHWGRTMPNLSFLKRAIPRFHRYYDIYYELAEHFCLYPNFRIFDMECLNSAEGVESILEFCNIPEKDRVVEVGIRHNADWSKLRSRK